MGLDIYLLTEARLVAPAAPDPDGIYRRPDGVDEEAMLIHTDPGYEDRLDGQERGWYDGDRERIKGFSYGGYSEFREILTRAVLGVEPEVVWAARKQAHEQPGAISPYVGRPFVDLIDFSDSEGAFAPEHCRRLAEDFRSYRTEVLKAMRAADYEYGADGYERIGEAFLRAGEAEALAFVVWR